MNELFVKQPEKVTQTSAGYNINGVTYPRVTSILKVINKPQLQQWYGKLGTEEAKKVSSTRADFGQAFHLHARKIIEQDPIIKTDIHYKDIADAEMKGCIKTFMQWIQWRNFGKRQCEFVLYSNKYNYAGTCDCTAYIDDILTICDWKTSKGIYNEYFLQLSAYANAIEELTGIYPERGAVLSVQGTGHYHYIWVGKELLKKIFPIFLSAKTLHKWQTTNWHLYYNEEKNAEAEL